MYKPVYNSDSTFRKQIVTLQTKNRHLISFLLLLQHITTDLTQIYYCTFLEVRAQNMSHRDEIKMSAGLFLFLEALGETTFLPLQRFLRRAHTPWLEICFLIFQASSGWLMLTSHQSDIDSSTSVTRDFMVRPTQIILDNLLHFKVR